MSAHSSPPGPPGPARPPRRRGPVLESPADTAGRPVRCPHCGARTASDITWCTQCHACLPVSPAPAVSSAPPVSGSGLSPEGSGRELTGGGLPPEVLEVLLNRLAEESVPVLPGRALAFTGRGGQFVVAVGGGLGLAGALVAVTAVFGRWF